MIKAREEYNRYLQEYKHLFEPYIEPQGKVYELDDFVKCLIKQKENLIDLIIHWIFSNTDRTDETRDIVKFLEVLKDDYFCGNIDCIINNNKKCYYNTSCKYRIKSNCKVGGENE